MIERFFGGVWNFYVFKFRFIIIFLFAIWLVISIIIAVDIGPLTEEEEFLPSDHPYMTIQKKIRENFSGQGARTIKIFVFWGIKSINNAKVGKWNPDELGELEWDDSFQFAPIDSQKELMYFCNDLKN